MNKLAGFIIFLSIFLNGCITQTVSDQPVIWNYVDLRKLDPADAPTASRDIVAVYAKIIADDLFLRIDWLDHPTLQDYDLYIAIDTRPGGKNTLPSTNRRTIEWDTLLLIPAFGAVESIGSDIQPHNGLAVGIFRNSVDDTVSIRIDLKNLMGGRKVWHSQIARLKFQVLLTDPDNQTILDVIEPFAYQDSPPAPASVLFAFWDTFQAYSPALAIRRWDGAHTGPLGGRHGLFNLIRAAAGGLKGTEESMIPSPGNETPIFLLDLKFPTSLSALDYFGRLDLIRILSASGAIVLPEFIPDLTLPDDARSIELVSKFISVNQKMNDLFMVAPSPFTTAPPDWIPFIRNTRIIFLLTQEDLSDDIRLGPIEMLRWRDQIIFPIPTNQSDQASLNGPTIQVRTALIDTAIKANSKSQDDPPVLVLGGSLPVSTWGDPQMARSTFRYLATRPWIRVLGASGLNAFHPTKSFLQNQLSFGEQGRDPRQAVVARDWFAEMLNSPKNPVSEAALQTYIALAAPTYPDPPDLPVLRKNYGSLLWAMLAAAEWAENPYSRVSCSTDLDGDNEPECILANEQIYTMYEIQDATLVFAFYRETQPGGNVSVHQFIGPSSQLIAGLSDPNTWDLSLGVRSDPNVLPGAFDERGKSYQPTTAVDRLIFISLDGSRRKTFSLVSSGITIEYRMLSSPVDTSLRIPLLLDPWDRFNPDWVNSYHHFKDTNGIYVGSGGDFQVYLESNSIASIESFSDSARFFDRPENPNFDYPAGHFLPFPIILVTIEGNNDIYVEIKISRGS